MDNSITNNFIVSMSSFMLLSTDQYLESTKSQEEIKQLIMVDQGSPQKNMIYIMTKGNPLQRPYVYRSFVPYWKDLLSYVVVTCQEDTAENQGIVTESMVDLLKTQGNMIGKNNLSKIFELCMHCINRENWNVNQLWGVVLQALLQIDSSVEKMQKIEEMIFELSKMSQPIISRVSAGRLISIISKYMRKLKPSMIDTLRSILSYPHSEPKLTWLRQFFPKLLKNCEFSFLEVHLQEKLMELVYDKDDNVGITALELIMKNCELFRKEEQHNRIAKLFVDAMTSREEKTILMISAIMGEVYEKLQDSIRMKEQVNVSFWESLMELSQSKNSNIINNFLFNLPGILTLSKSYYNIEPISEVYIGLFYQNLASKSQLICCFHQMIKIFPSRKEDFKEIIYDIFEEVFDEDKQDYEEIYNVIDIFLSNFDKVSSIFLYSARQDKEMKLQENIVKYLIGYWGKIEKRRNATQIQNYQKSLLASIPLISFDHLMIRFVPKLFSSLKCNLPHSKTIIECLISSLHQVVGNLNYITGYVSKIFIEFGKSVRSFEREIAVRFFIELIKCFSMEITKQLKIVDKLLYFSTDKSFNVRYSFISQVHTVRYLLTKQELIEYEKIIIKYKSSNDFEINEYISNHKSDFQYDIAQLDNVKNMNNEIREAEKVRQLLIPQQKKSNIRRDSSTFKEARVSLKDETLKTFNRKKILLNEFATVSATIDTNKQKKKFKISTKITKKA